KVEPTRLEIRIHQKSDFKYRTDFIGAKGNVLQRSEENPAVYDLKSAEGYVRAKVYDSGGFVAWVQPVFVWSK
ncbi:MAG: hypothetical protein HY089_11280, partial [Ignavibacteriales bacterium]|nr:hypothetical protein [Ignavibacteriales bacterium]